MFFTVFVPNISNIRDKFIFANCDIYLYIQEINTKKLMRGKKIYRQDKKIMFMHVFT